MTNPVVPPPNGGVNPNVPVAPVSAQAPGATAPPAAPAPVAPVDPAAAPVAEGQQTDDQSLLAMQMNARFSVVKQSGDGEAGASKTGDQTPAPPAAAPAGPPQPAAAPAPATLPSTTG